MKLEGFISQKRIVVLIDSGASHFISSKVAQSLQLPVTLTNNYGITVGTGVTVPGTGICKGIVLSLPTVDVIDDFLPLELGNTDVILGMHWLASLGHTQTNWGTLTIKFKVSGQWVTLQGDPSLCRQEASLRLLQKAFKVSGEGVLIEFSSMAGPSTSTEDTCPTSVRQLFEKFGDVFSWLAHLPPLRTREYSITLLPGSAPINVCPFRYPHSQKVDIEKLVSEMLAAHIIRPSFSPFSSPVLLVKKKDGSWRFCVDYRALNKATVPDKFPIPIIGELCLQLMK